MYIVRNSNVSMYADDTSISHQSRDHSAECGHVEKWLKGNKLSLNVLKINAILISTKAKQKALIDRSESSKLQIRESELEVVQKTRYHAVQIYNSLDWKKHVKTVSSKVSRAIGYLKHTKSSLPEETLRTMYTGIVEPHFRYCCSVWGSCGVIEINQLQKLQNRAARIVSSFDTPGQPLIKRLGWKTTDELVASESYVMFFISLHELAPQCMCDLFTKTSQLTSRNLRNTSTVLRVTKEKLRKWPKMFFSYRGAKSWNGVSAECKLASSLNRFKQRI